MAWVTLGYSRKRVDRAGQLLADDQFQWGNDYDEALEVLSNWRSSHSFPLNTIQMNLRNRAREVDAESLVAQRLKRVPSIIAKLKRMPGMQLSRMQDIGGCRAVVGSVHAVTHLRESLARSHMRHVLVAERDYIRHPKESGYRSLHLVYRYTSDRSTSYNSHLVEVQLRSQLQHAWATAVETVGIFLNEALKSSEGSGTWLEFFSLTSSAFAMLENQPLVPGAPSTDVIIARVRDMAGRLEVRQKLEAYRNALVVLEAHKGVGHYYLLSLRPAEHQLKIQGYTKHDRARATVDYLKAEQEARAIEGAEVVLVAADSVDNLRKAYPNYFLDSHVFLRNLQRVIG